jgi:alanine dehydrogenase
MVMLIGVPKEIKNNEFRVGLTPASVRELIANGHQVLVQNNAGTAIGLDDAQYQAAGAEMVAAAADIFARAEMIVKVKEPQPVECAMLRPGQILYTYLHLAPDPEQTKLHWSSLARSASRMKPSPVPRGGLPLLAPMSQVAGRMAMQAGATHLEKEQGGRGLLLGGVPGVAPAHVVIIGGGVVGTNAAAMALGLGADVTILEKSTDRMEELVARFGTQLKTVYSTQGAVEDECAEADLVIGGVLIPGAAAPKLVTKKMLPTWKKGSVSWTSPSTKEAAAETSRPRHMPTRLTRWMASFTTASPTCPAAWRARQPTPSTTPPLVTLWRWPTRAGRLRCAITCI